MTQGMAQDDALGTERWSVSGPQVIELADVHRLRVRLIGGRVDVVAHDGDEVRLEVAGVQGQPLEVLRHGDTLDVSHPQLGWESLLDRVRVSGRSRDAAQVSVAVPRGTAVELGTVSAEGLLAGTTADAEVRTVSGSLVLDGVRAPVRVRTVSGDVDVRDQDGPLIANAVSGSLTLSGAGLHELSAKTVSGDVAADLQLVPARVNLTSVSGDLTLRLPDGTGYDLQVRTVSGRVLADGQRLQRQRGGPARGRFTSGDGAVVIEARTVSGDVVLLSATGSTSEDAG